MDWSKLASASHYQTAVAVRQELAAENIEEAQRGLEELIDALGRSDKRALRSQLTRLMTHILKWGMQPDRRSRSWVASITDARIEIEGLLEDEPSLRRELPDIWDRCFQAAQRLARDETGVEPTGASLTMAEVFDVAYDLED
ncbi:MAG: DUF29 domain-containing protein [Anaerolineae bacterium]|nr:DUF29 domain-containing protein [Anaerolineae bacterium]